ncbi:MAG: DNA polymerase I [Bacilli bacterium]|nr:DNA polymerase I [Bacilli bacterium]
MKKVILVDGNNLLFRSYYATAYSGNLMNNSKGFPTNGLYGLVNMLNKIIKEEKPEYMLVAFDKGKTFRHEKYKSYKEGRIKTPDDLLKQFEVAKKLVPLMGIKMYEIDNYEADDIIGTYSRLVSEDKDFDSLIVSSDKDLLQLINKENTVKLLKSKDYIMMDEKTFFSEYGITPDKMIDLKGLMGDSSDNIPGVKGIGEKTALKLLQDYGSIEGIYENIDSISGKTKEKLLEDKENAFMSKDIATIYKEVPLEYSLEDLKYTGEKPGLIELYKELEFYSFVKNVKVKSDEKLDYKIVSDPDELELVKDISIFVETDKDNYHDATILGISIYDGTNLYYLDNANDLSFLKGHNISSYDIKKNIVLGLDYKYDFDTMIAAYILNYNLKDDISYLASEFSCYITPYAELKKDKNLTVEKIAEESVKKVKFIFDTKEDLVNKLKEEDQYKLFDDIEMKLAHVLASMEIEGIRVDSKVLDKIGEKLENRLEELTNEIYSMAGEEFNIQSPKQLGDILFVKMGIPYPKKNPSSFSTSREILDKIAPLNPIVEKIIDYRTLAKLYNTYIIGIKAQIKEDGKLHTIYTQTLTRTGRLSSIEPNLQNIPIRYEEGKLIRKAFVPEENSVFISSDYSQIELRVFAHLSNEKNMIDAFNKGLDIHTKTAMDIFHKSESEVTKNDRRCAKAVNFGILYGISTFGLASDIGINLREAKEFMEEYLTAYPGIRDYQQRLIDEAYKNGYVTTIMNRKRNIEELNNTNYIIRSQGERIAQNTPIQGSASDILKKAMIDIYEEFNKEGLKSKMLLQIHDELVFNVVDGEKTKVKAIIKDKMENVYKLSVPLVVDIEEGTNWYDAK